MKSEAEVREAFDLLLAASHAPGVDAAASARLWAQADFAAWVLGGDSLAEGVLADLRAAGVRPAGRPAAGSGPAGR